MLSADEIEAFVTDGFVRIPQAFDRTVADECVDSLWTQLAEERDDPATWMQPVQRIAGSGAPPIVSAINTPRLVEAIDQLVGAGRWQRRTAYGTFPIRFPSETDPGDAGWHLDGSFEFGDEPPPWNYWVNLRSKQRALLALLLYTDVGPDDAPTRVRVGSHVDVARALAGHDDSGASFVLATQEAEPGWTDRAVVEVVGDAGDVYLCHPFLVHSASWPHRGATPRFIGQPCIHHDPADDGFTYERADGGYSPCEVAVRRALGTER